MRFLYLDPGSGSILLQLLIAALAGIGIAVGSQWAKIKRFFDRLRRREPEVNEADNDE